MSFKIIRNDITKVHAEAIVNTANPIPKVGRGTDFALYEACGYEELLNYRKKIGVIDRGCSVESPAFNLSKNGVKYIIHTVGTWYYAKEGDKKAILRGCYSSSLNLAKKLGCKSIAIPLLGTGYYEYPKDLSLKIAIEEISSLLLKEEIEIILVVYDEKSYLISKKLFDDIQDFLHQNLEKKDTALAPNISSQKIHSQNHNNSLIETSGIESFLNNTKQTYNFQNNLQHQIAKRNLDNATIYKKAGIDKKFFSKIITKKDYIPKKQTVIALGLALELSEQDFTLFLESAGYTFIPSNRFDQIIKYCIVNKIFNIVEVNFILHSYGENCFAPE